MKKLPLSLAALATVAVFAAAEPTAYNEAAMLAKGVPARAVMDGAAVDPIVLAQATTDPPRPPAPLAPAANLSPRVTPPAAPAKEEPSFFSNFFSKAWGFVKTPAFYVPLGAAVVFAAMGFMIAGPLGALTGAAIGGLLGYVVTKAL